MESPHKHDVRKHSMANATISGAGEPVDVIDSESQRLVQGADVRPCRTPSEHRAEDMTGLWAVQPSLADPRRQVAVRAGELLVAEYEAKGQVSR